MNNKLTLLIFSEALYHLKNKETEYMIRAKWFKRIDFLIEFLLCIKLNF